jgi:peptidyl-prolyl cis-trans isomerase C
MKSLIIALGSTAMIGLLTLAGGCAKKDAAAPAADAGKPVVETDVVARVDGEPISRAVYDYYVRTVTSGKTAAELTPQQRDQLLEALVRNQLVAKQARKEGLDKESETAALLQLAQLEILQQAVAQKYLRDKQPTDAELHAEYDTQVAAMPRAEYRAHHIQVATEDFARNLIRQLDRGAKFEELARKESLDTASREQGGDLGNWFKAATMVAPFADALARLKKGETTTSPVKTEYGWHVIRLDDIRETAAPPFDSARDQLGQLVLKKKFTTYTEGLVKAAKVEKKL